MGVIYRNDINLGAQSRPSAGNGGSKAHSGEATDDTDYSNVPGGPTPHPLRKNGSTIRIHPPTSLNGKLGWSALTAPLHDG